MQGLIFPGNVRSACATEHTGQGWHALASSSSPRQFQVAVERALKRTYASIAKVYEDRSDEQEVDRRGPIGLCRFLPCFLVFAVTMNGCGGYTSSAPTYEVKGKVLLANGKTLSAGRVTFVAADGLLPEASGEIQPDGGFSLTTGTGGRRSAGEIQGSH